MFTPDSIATLPRSIDDVKQSAEDKEWIMNLKEMSVSDDDFGKWLFFESIFIDWQKP